MTTERSMPQPPSASLMFTGLGDAERLSIRFDAGNLDHLDQTFSSMRLLDRILLVEMCRAVVEGYEAWRVEPPR